MMAILAWIANLKLIAKIRANIEGGLDILSKVPNISQHYLCKFDAVCTLTAHS